MSHYRTELRAAVQAALAAVPRLAGVTYRSALDARPDRSQLPEMSCLIQRERVTRDMIDGVRRAIDVTVAVRRVGAAALDDLDADGAAIEAAVLPVLAAALDDVELTLVEISTDRDGSAPMGQIALTFEGVRFTAAGAPD